MNPPQISARWLKIFQAYNRRYLRRHFHSLRIARHALPQVSDEPLVVYLNHPSWWDPLVCFFLAEEFFSARASFAPMESEMLKRYRFFRRLGFFGIEPRSVSGARTLLQAGRTILQSSQRMLWLTPQGEFTDPRARPLKLQSGLAALAAALPTATFLPLALEYTFWTESRPEILVAFGKPIAAAENGPCSPNEWTEIFSARLADAQTQLANLSIRRDANDWIVLDRGRAGINFLYDAWHKLRARWRGESSALEHQPQPLAR